MLSPSQVCPSLQCSDFFICLCDQVCLALFSELPVGGQGRTCSLPSPTPGPVSGTELLYSLLSACSVYAQGGRTRSFDPPEPGLPVPIAGIKDIQRLEVHANHRGLGLEEAKLKSGCKDRVIAGWSGLRDC